MKNNYSIDGLSPDQYIGLTLDGKIIKGIADYDGNPVTITCNNSGKLVEFPVAVKGAWLDVNAHGFHPCIEVRTEEGQRFSIFSDDVISMENSRRRARQRR